MKILGKKHNFNWKLPVYKLRKLKYDSEEKTPFSWEISHIRTHLTPKTFKGKKTKTCSLHTLTSFMNTTTNTSETTHCYIYMQNGIFRRERETNNAKNLHVYNSYSVHI